MPLRVQGEPINLRPAPASAVPPPPGAAALNIPRIAQEQTNWCWAAFSEMVFRFHGITNVRQCDMASWRFGASCCAAPSTSVCNAPSWPDTVLANWGINHSYAGSSANLGSIQFEIGGNRPVGVYYTWLGGGAHVALVTGWYDNNDVEIADPWYTHGRITYGDLMAAYGLGSWAGTYTNLRPI